MPPDERARRHVIPSADQCLHHRHDITIKLERHLCFEIFLDFNYGQPAFCCFRLHDADDLLFRLDGAFELAHTVAALKISARSQDQDDS